MAILVPAITNVNKGAPNGTKWTRKLMVNGSSQSWVGLYGHGKWVTPWNSRVYYSRDGKNWRTISGFSTLKGTIYGWYVGNKFYISASAQSFVSDDGINFVPLENITANITSMYYRDGIYLLRTAENLYYSNDGTVFFQTELIVASDYNLTQSIGYGKGRFCAGYTANKGIYYSDDGQTWEKTNLSTGYFQAVYHNSRGIWNAGNGMNTYYSLNGIEWIKAGGKAYDIRRIQEGDGFSVAEVGGKLAYSTDGGLSWADCEGISGRTIGKATYSNGIWVAGDTYNSIDATGVFYSEDGIIWTQSNLNGGVLRFVANDSGVWIIGVDNYIYYSLDGKQWTQSQYTYTPTWAHCKNGIWVLGASGGVYYSDVWQPL